MDGSSLEIANAAKLHQAGMDLLDEAGEIIARRGRNPNSMAEVGGLLCKFAESGVLGELLLIRPGGKPAAVDVIAQHADGSILSLYAMENWKSPPSTDVHWHNYWQVLLCIEGSWPDTVWKPVDAIENGIARGIAIDRDEIIGEGTLQALRPDEPHGWVADNIRHADKATLLMWSGSADGLPRTVLDIDTGELSEEFDFLNPRPDERRIASTACWNRF